MTKQHDKSPSSETYRPESIATEVQKGDYKEAARELNRDLHSSKDFNSIYKKVNSQIDKLNTAHNTHLPHIELVGADGSASTTAGADKSQVKGIKIDNSTFNTDTVRNNTIVDAATSGKTVNSADGTSKNYDMHNNLVEKTSDGGTKTTYKIPEAHRDTEIGNIQSQTDDGKGNQILTSTDGNKKTLHKDGSQTIDWAKPSDHKDDRIGNVVQESTDAQGNKILSAENGGKKTTYKGGNQVVDYANGDRDIDRPDNSGEKIRHQKDRTYITSWSQTHHEGNYYAIVKNDGSYKKWGNYGPHNTHEEETGKNYKYQPGEK